MYHELRKRGTSVAGGGMEILTANAGFCLGITRAYRAMNERALAEAPFAVAHQNAGGEFDTLSRIERRDPELLARYPGLANVAVPRDVSALGRGDRLVLGFHGLNRDTKEGLAARGVDLLDDLICPFIAKLDRVVERLAAQGFDIAIVGTKDNHHCRVARKIAEQNQRRCYVIERADDVDTLPREAGRPVALVGQVTGDTEVFTEVIERIRTSETPVKVVKTMCSDSYSRQRAAADLAREADLVILMDDGGGAAQSLFDVCSRINKRVHRVRAKEDIRAEWLEGARKAAIVGGILVPEWSIQEAARHVRAISR
jgi:4-hydroxy-3-methylbut-2-en-1-yl diphosphate reductase